MTAGLRCHAATVIGLVAAFAMVAGCSGPRSGASATSEVSGCAAVLPLARDIVHDEGTLTLVRRINQGDADALSRRLGATPPAPHPAPRGPHPPARSTWPKACLVVYHGSYPAGTITETSPPAVAGHYTLMVLRLRHPSVERILVTDQLPPGLKP
ncbi:MAG: hypothetical protein ACRDRU_09125 [Pseudonocardiaceae bacterium]